jgi:hypothetical protein
VSPEEDAAMYERAPKTQEPGWGEYLTNPAAYVGHTAKQLGMSESGANRLGRDTNVLMNAVPPLAVEASPLGVMGNTMNASSVPKAAAPVLPKVAVKPSSVLEETKRGTYKVVDDMGATYSPYGYGRMVDAMEAAAQAKQISPDRHPKAWSMLEDLKKKRGSRPTITQLDQDRQVIYRDVKGDEAEQFFGELMVEQLDDFIDNAGFLDMPSGGSKEAQAAILAARKANSEFRKTQTLENALAQAERNAAKSGAGGNIDNAVRQEIDRIIKGKEAKFYTLDELDALDKAVKGKLAGKNLHNFSRLVGKMSPEGNGAALLVQLLLAGHTSGASLPLAAAGIGAKRMADHLSRKNIDLILQQIQRGN